MIIQRRALRIPNAEVEIKGILDGTFDEGRGCIMELDAVDEPLETSQRWIQTSKSSIRSMKRSALD